MSAEKSQSVRGTVAASPEAAFALLADPSRHTDLDGADMLRGVEPGSGPVTGVGDASVMNMEQDGIGTYRMRSEVTAFEAGRTIAWAPAIHPEGSLKDVIGDLDPSGHTYGWLLEANGEGGTTVTHTYDWSGVTDADALALYPRVSEEQMAQSIAKLGDALA